MPYPSAHSVSTRAAQSLQAIALALVDCVQDTFNNVAALLSDSVHNLSGGKDQNLEKIVIDLNRVDNGVTNIVAGVRSMSMAFKVIRQGGDAED